MEFKVGDIVKFKSWEEMEEEYGLNGSGNIKCEFCFTTEMEQTIDKNSGYVIERIEGSRIYLNGAPGYTYSKDMLKPCDCEKNIINFRIGKLNRTDVGISSPSHLEVFFKNIWGLLFLGRRFVVDYEFYDNDAIEIVEYYKRHCHGLQVLYLSNTDKIKTFDNYEFTIKEPGRYILKEDNLTFVCILIEEDTEEIVSSTLKTANMLFEGGFLEIGKEFYDTVISLDYDKIMNLFGGEMKRLEAEKREKRIYSQMEALEQNILKDKIDKLNASINVSKNNQMSYLNNYRRELNSEKELRKELIFLTSDKEANKNINDLINLLKEDYKRGEIFDLKVENENITIQFILPLLYFEEEDWTLVRKTYREEYAAFEDLLDAIFNKEATVIFNNSVTINLNESSFKGINRRYYDRKEGIPNPHIERYDCWGGNEPEISDYLYRGMYDMAYLQIKSAICGLNISDAPVMKEFCYCLYSFDVPTIVIEETGELMTAEKAEHYFKEKAKEEHHEED